MMQKHITYLLLLILSGIASCKPVMVGEDCVLENNQEGSAVALPQSENEMREYYVSKSIEAFRNGNIRESLDYYATVASYRDSALLKELSDSLRIQKERFDKEEARVEFRLQMQRLVLTIAVIILTVLMVFFVMSRRRQISDLNQNLSEMRREYMRMCRKQLRTLGRLAGILANSKESSNKEMFYKAHIEQLAGGLTSSSEADSFLEQSLDRYMDRIMTQFREDFPDYDDESYRFIACSFSGFDVWTMMIIFDIPSRGAYDMKLDRIRKKIKKSEVPRKEEYLELLYRQFDN